MNHETQQCALSELCLLLWCPLKARDLVPASGIIKTAAELQNGLRGLVHVCVGLARLHAVCQSALLT